MIYTYGDKTHVAGISFSNFNKDSIPQIVIDGDNFGLIPNNKRGGNNNKIVDMYVDHSVIPWRLVLKIYIDGSLYTQYASLND